MGCSSKSPHGVLENSESDSEPRGEENVDGPLFGDEPSAMECKEREKERLEARLDEDAAGPAIAKEDRPWSPRLRMQAPWISRLPAR